MNSPQSPLLSVRHATLADAAYLLRLRNDAQTVAMARERSPVDARDHIAWLSRALADPTRRLMIVEHARRPATLGVQRVEPRGDLCVGTYRLDDLGSPRVEVSLTLAPEWRGRGLARQVIELAARHAVWRGADTLIAEIRRENIPSFVAFFRNGFMITGWRAGILSLDVAAEEVIRRACPLCLARTPHHTNSRSGIGRADDRQTVYDIHAVEDSGGVGLKECEAGDLWLAWEGARRRRLQGSAGPDASGLIAGSSPAASTNAVP